MTPILILGLKIVSQRSSQRGVASVASVLKHVLFLKHVSDWHYVPFSKMGHSETCFILALYKLRHMKAAC